MNPESEREVYSGDREIDLLVRETAEALAIPKLPERYVRTWDEIRVDKILRAMYGEQVEPEKAEKAEP